MNKIKIDIVEITRSNINDYGIVCIKDKKAKSREAKINWVNREFDYGYGMLQAIDEKGRSIAFIEWIPVERAWRGVEGTNFWFIQCLALYAKKYRNMGIAGRLLHECEDRARKAGKAGLCVLSSHGPWMAKPDIFLKNGFIETAFRERFHLLCKGFTADAQWPVFSTGQVSEQKDDGFVLYYSHQCPWHYKSVQDLTEYAQTNTIPFQAYVLDNTSDRKALSGIYGTYALFYNGRLIEDHYLSKRRFENICNKLLNK